MAASAGTHPVWALENKLKMFSVCDACAWSLKSGPCVRTGESACVEEAFELVANYIL